MPATRSTSAEVMLRIRATLPAKAFQPDPSKLVWMFIHLAIIVACHIAAGRVGFSWWLVAPVVIAALSLSCIGFYTHDLSHGSIVRSGPALRGLELIFWGLLFTSPTMWRRLHNQAHHVHYGTAADPDRQFFTDEHNASTRWYSWLLFPNDEVFPWNPLVYFHFVVYVIRNTITVFLPASLKPAVVPVRPDYRPAEVARITGELLVIALFQFGLFAACGYHFWLYAIMAASLQGVTSCITMFYIFTNHFANGFSHEADPVASSTSVIVPPWMDRVHAHFSYHTEHHLLPALNSNYYPQVSQVLAELFPTTYRRIPILEAWRQLWKNRLFEIRPVPPAESPEPAATQGASIVSR